MENYIIELRNKDSVDTVRIQGSNLQEGNPNGVWTTNIQAGADLMLEEGDTLICRNTFIDTRAENDQKIVIVEDTPITISYYYYANNWNGNLREYISNSTWRTTNTSFKTPINATDNRVIAQSDGKPYIACKKTTDGNNYKFQKSLTYVGQNALQGVGGFPVFIRYRDSNGDIRETKVELPKYFEVGWGTDSQLDINICYKNTPPFPDGQDKGIACFLANSSGGIDLSKRMDGTGLEFQDTRIQAFTDETTLQGNLFQPHLASSTFTLPAGSYDPTELCEVINAEMTSVGKVVPTISDLSGNELLVTIGGDDGTGNFPNTEFNNFVRFQQDDDPTIDGYGFQYTEGVNSPSILGASQFVLAYDDDTNRFNFQFLHTPLFSQADGSNGGSSELGGLCNAQGWTGDQENNENPVLPTNKYRVSSNGGILLADLQPASLWNTQLGFDLDRFIRDQTGKPTNTPNPNCCLVGFNQKAKNNAGVNFTTNGLQSSLPFFYNLPVDGKQKTTGFLGVNTIFDKGKGFQQSVQLPTVTNKGEAKSKFVLIGDSTTQIDANKSVLSQDNTEVSFGYFLVEVQGNFINNYLNQTGNFKHIVSIVSRYYSRDNYTTSSSADSIIYTHKGDPVLLNSFNCKIMNSEKQIAQNIGGDNTIILELVKADKVKSPKK